jgi:hypothetical protein
MAKGSYRMLGRILGIHNTLVCRWVRSFGESLGEPEVCGEIRQMGFDEMWHFIGSKKKLTRKHVAQTRQTHYPTSPDNFCRSQLLGWM